MSKAMEKVLGAALKGDLSRTTTDSRTLNALVARGYLRKKKGEWYKITAAGKKALKAA